MTKARTFKKAFLLIYTKSVSLNSAHVVKL